MSVGDTVGKNLWGHDNPLEVTMDEMLIVTNAVRRGVKHALVSADFPYGPLQEGRRSAVRAAIRLVKEAGVDMIKLDGAADYPEAVTALTRAGIPVWAQFGLTPQTALRWASLTRTRPGAGRACRTAWPTRWSPRRRCSRRPARCCSISPIPAPWSGPRVVEAVTIPVIGGFGGGPWLDGRVRLAQAAVGYDVAALDNEPKGYANVARVIHDALTECAGDVRAARQIKGQPGR